MEEQLSAVRKEPLWDSDHAVYTIVMKLDENGKPCLALVDNPPFPANFPYYNFDKHARGDDYEPKLARRIALQDAASKFGRFLADKLEEFLRI